MSLLHYTTIYKPSFFEDLCTKTFRQAITKTKGLRLEFVEIGVIYKY